jgi:hypothetical protein
MAVVVGLGYGPTRWVFVLLVWAVLIFVPLRIAIESAESFGTTVRRSIVDRLASDPARYQRAEYLPVVVQDLAARRVALPRICGPRHGRAARDAAVALIARVNAAPGAQAGLRAVVRALLAVIGQEAAALSAGTAADNIQARWETARALGTLGALVAILLAVHEDRWGELEPLPELSGRDREQYLTTAMDYCDEAALEVEAMPWTEPPLTSSLPVDRIEAIRETWAAFLAAGLPAPRALEAFTGCVLQARDFTRAG